MNASYLSGGKCRVKVSVGARVLHACSCSLSLTCIIFMLLTLTSCDRVKKLSKAGLGIARHCGYNTVDGSGSRREQMSNAPSFTGNSVEGARSSSYLDRIPRSDDRPLRKVANLQKVQGALQYATGEYAVRDVDAVSQGYIRVSAQVKDPCGRNALSAISVQLRIRPEDINSSVACGLMPDDPGRMIVAFSTAQLRTADVDSYGLTVVELKRDNLGVIRKFSDEAALMSYQVFQGNTLDTGRYWLAPNIRAFGVKSSFGGTRTDAIYYESLKLFVERDEKLVNILDGLITIANLGTPGAYDGNCESGHTLIMRTIEVAKTASHGMADLIVHERSDEIVDLYVGGKCEFPPKAKRTSRQYVLRFDGVKYPIPKKIGAKVFYEDYQ